MPEPITVWATASGPNPWKVVMLCEELSIPYKLNAIGFEYTKAKPFIDINPNGRVPAIEDPNTGITLWESGAIILYLIEQYDKENKFSYADLKQRHLLNQWLMFQISGQGPYFGQAGWFNHLHPEKLPSAIERYVNEMKRILGVLELTLKDREWLVGDKLTFADLSFVWWNQMAQAVCGTPESPLEDFPRVIAWHKKMTERPSFKKCWELRGQTMNAQNLDYRGLPTGVSVQEMEARGKAIREGQGD